MTDGPSRDTDAARFAAIVDSSSDAITSMALDGTIETWNPAAERLFGWPAADIIGQSITRIIPADLIGEEQRVLECIRAGEIVPRFQTRRLTRGGEDIPIALTVSPVRDAGGTVIGASKIASDLRETARLAQGLRQTTDQFTALADTIPQLAWMADARGSLFWYNRRWYDYTGTTLEEMAGWGWQKVHHPDHVDRVSAKVQGAWDSGEPWEDTFPLRRADGIYRWFLSGANPLRDEAGNLVIWCGTNTDITDQLEAQNRIALLMREVNHRSRNMLATIQGIVKRSRSASIEQLTEALQGRIAALASNQELLDGGDWSGARIVDVMQAQIAHLGEGERARISLAGPEDLTLDAIRAEALGLAIHELATNAEKYGALSVPGGAVAIDWAETGADDPQLAVSWHERGGPPVAKPTHQGFGTMLITRNIEGIFGTAVSLEYESEGLRWSFSCPSAKCLIERIERVKPASYM